MRLSEKTIEINICSQLNALFKGQIIWFGLTQRQEAKAGFDACAKFRGRLILFQFKASNKNTRVGRQFYTSHTQLQNLVTRAGKYTRSVFYVFPLIGTTRELKKYNGNIASNSWALDVSSLPNPFPPPYTRSGRTRRNGIHYIDVKPPNAIIHSEPVEKHMLKLSDFIAEGAPDAEGIYDMFQGDFNNFYDFTRMLGRHAVAALLLPNNT
jgi:hypothetical protein